MFSKFVKSAAVVVAMPNIVMVDAVRCGCSVCIEKTESVKTGTMGPISVCYCDDLIKDEGRTGVMENIDNCKLNNPSSFFASCKAEGCHCTLIGENNGIRCTCDPTYKHLNSKELKATVGAFVGEMKEDRKQVSKEREDEMKKLKQEEKDAAETLQKEMRASSTTASSATASSKKEVRFAPTASSSTTASSVGPSASSTTSTARSTRKRSTRGRSTSARSTRGRSTSARSTRRCTTSVRSTRSSRLAAEANKAKKKAN